MSSIKDPFEVVMVEDDADLFEALARKPVAVPLPHAAVPGAVTARLHGFDLDDQPLVAGLPELRGETVVARTTVSLLRSHVGATVVVLFESGDVRRPIIVGVLNQPVRPDGVEPAGASELVAVQADGERVVLSAEREIVLRCGAASITLTRAGKVLIKGAYILSRSTGYNKIKGAAVDIN
jgi:hypothetical protein